MTEAQIHLSEAINIFSGAGATRRVAQARQLARSLGIDAVDL